MNIEDEILKKTSIIKNEIEYEVTKIGDANKNIFKHIKKKSLESKLQRIKEIEEILKIEKYKIVFIGTIGAGKTTAISHLFNLIGIFDRQEEINKKVISIKKTESLFSTGSGRTTICEIIIKPSDKTYIEIEPHSKEKVVSYIKEFCENFYLEESDGEALPIELERAIRSFTNLKKSKRKDSDGKEKQFDPAREFASSMPVEEFIKLALDNAKLDSRNYIREKSNVFCPENQDEKLWIKENFEKINRGDNATFSIPKKIYVYVSKRVLGESELSFFESVIDTKGIDEISLRPDLGDYIEREDTICLFTTRYNDAPETNVRNLMKYFLTQKSKKYESRFITFVMPHKGEPEKENDNTDNSWENGIELKRDIILDIFKKLHLNFLNENILFFDALGHYDDKYRLIQDYSLDDVQKVKTEMIFQIKYRIELRKELLGKEVDEIQDSLKSLKTGNDLMNEDQKFIYESINSIKTNSDIKKRIPEFIYKEFLEKYIEYYSISYPAWNTKDAIHRRLGVFEERNFDTYYDIKVVSEGLSEDEMLRKFTKKMKEDILDDIERLGNQHSDLKSLTTEMSNRFEVSYDSFIRNVGNEMEFFLRQSNSNYEFWNDLINRRGKGKGYNEDVARMLKKNLNSIDSNNLKEHISSNELLRIITEKHWQIVISQLLSFFGEASV